MTERRSAQLQIMFFLHIVSEYIVSIFTLHSTSAVNNRLTHVIKNILLIVFK